MTTINIEDFFTVDNEQEGVWFEPKINGMSCGLEFLLTGKNTDANVAATERYDKQVSKLEEIKDPIEKAKKRNELEASRVADFVKGLREVDGVSVNYGGKKIEYSVPLVKQIFLKSPLIKNQVIDFVLQTTNFIKRKKND
jgi:hypothetical protein